MSRAEYEAEFVVSHPYRLAPVGWERIYQYSGVADFKLALDTNGNKGESSGVWDAQRVLHH